MNACTLISEDPNRMLGELVALESVISMAEGLLGWAKPRHEALLDQLDLITRPTCTRQGESDAPPARPAFQVEELPPPRQRHYEPRGYFYKGEFHRAMSAIDIYKELMNRLLQDHPDKHAAIKLEVGQGGRNRAYLSHDRTTLFVGRGPEWARQHSVELQCGWYLDTNLSNNLKLRLLRAAVKAVGLSWGKDVHVRLKGAFVDGPGDLN